MLSEEPGTAHIELEPGEFFYGIEEMPLRWDAR